MIFLCIVLKQTHTALCVDSGRAGGCAEREGYGSGTWAQTGGGAPGPAQVPQVGHPSSPHTRNHPPTPTHITVLK